MQNLELASKSKKNPSPARYDGPCPYECDDPRCANYSEPNPDCGGTPEPTPQVSITSVQDAANRSMMINSFQSLAVNFVQLSTALGITDTLDINDINFENLSRSYITNDDGTGEAIVAPFKRNTSNTTINYAFAVTVDAQNIYKPYIIKTSTNQYLKYFDLDENSFLQ